MRGDLRNCAPQIYVQRNSSSAVTVCGCGLTVNVNPSNRDVRRVGNLRADKWPVLDGKARAAGINGRKGGLFLTWAPQNRYAGVSGMCRPITHGERSLPGAMFADANLLSGRIRPQHSTV